jgi:hypothetical protein
VRRHTFTGTYTATTSGPYTIEFHNWRNAAASNDIKNYIDDIVLEPAVADFSIETDNISVSTGGSVDMALLAGAAHGGEYYFVLGGLGTYPGFTLDGVRVHLNNDALFAYAQSHPNSGAFQNSFGVLNGSGQATCSFNTGGPTNPAFLGLSFNFAYVLLTSPGTRPITYGSLPVKVNFIP